MRSLLIVLLLIGMAVGQLPSDLITKQPAPAVLDLRNTAPASALAIDSLNPELQAFKLVETAPLGHYNTALVEVTQVDMETVTNATKAFLVGDQMKGNGTIEPMNLTEYNGTMVMW